MTGIYKITNTLNNKCYIGQSVDIENRWKEHIRECQYLRKKTKFYLALNKYGIEFFKFEVLEECPLEPKILDEREQYWIEYYDSYNHGYNSTLGGQSATNQKYDPQVIRDLWDEGHSAKEIAEMVGCSADTVYTRLQGYNDYNPHTSLSRAAQYARAERTPIGFQSTVIYQYNLNGQYIAEYESISEAARVLGHDNPSAIHKVLTHKHHTAFGYQWSREKVESMPMAPVSHGKLVKCINTNQIFHSTHEAAAWCNLKSPSNIKECCRGQRKTAGKHPETGEKLKWEYIEI